MFCTNCGASGQEDSRFCVNCGDSLGEENGDKKLFYSRMLNLSSLKKIAFLKTLFNFSFNEFVTSKMTKFLYGLSILLAAFMGLILVIVGFNTSVGLGILALLIGAPFVFLLIVVYSRVLLEMIIAIFHMAGQATQLPPKSESKDSIQWNIK